jgi:hypothetical protein
MHDPVVDRERTFPLNKQSLPAKNTEYTTPPQPLPPDEVRVSGVPTVALVDEVIDNVACATRVDTSGA